MEIPVFGRTGNGSFEDLDLNDVFGDFFLEPGSELPALETPSTKRGNDLPKSLGISLSAGHKPASIPSRPEVPATSKPSNASLPKSLGISLSVDHKPSSICRPDEPSAPKRITGNLPPTLSSTVDLEPVNIPDQFEAPAASKAKSDDLQSGYANGKKQEMWCPLPTSSVAKGGKEVRSAFASAREPNTVEPSDDQVERRARNREHAKKSRVRKKFLFEALQDQVAALQKDNQHLRHIMQEEMPKHARDIYGVCSTVPGAHADMPTQGDLVHQDLTLMQALISSQQTFTVSDPKLPDNPIVFASQGFLNLTGYKMEEVLGRNCRFLQGPETDQRAVDEIRKGIEAGSDVSVCLKNYKAGGTPFWNRFFVAALRDASGEIIRYVGVQSEVSKEVRAKAAAARGQKRAFGN